MGVAVQYEARALALECELKFKGDGKLLKFKQCFFQSRSEEELRDLFQVRAQWLQGSPWQ